MEYGNSRSRRTAPIEMLINNGGTTLSANYECEDDKDY